MRAATAIAVLALCLGAAVAAPLTVTVTVGANQIPLTVNDNEDVVQAATAFVEKHGLGADVVGAIVAELERQAVAAAAAAPVLTLPLTVGSVEANLQYYEGQVPEEAARAFLTENGVPAGDNFERLVGAVAAEVRKALELGGQQQQQQAAAQAQERPIVATVEVNMGDAGLVPLHVREGDTPNGAAAAFVRAHGLGDDAVDTLSRAIQKKVAEEQSARAATAQADAEAAALFTMAVEVDGVQRTLLYHEGRQPADVARQFAREMGVTDEAAIASIQEGIQRRLADRQTVSFMLGDQAFDLEYVRGAADVGAMSRGFCNAEWASVQKALAAAGTSGVSLDVCVSTVSQLLSTKVV